ncbi:hypothetical protein BCD48_03850 [Pseudofrankia sp. BMG5.36]|nr:hypothetical protein BCD48_03850 [Pseudofrankia sp. BMG5.36]
MFANRPTCDLEQLRGDLRGRWRVAVRAVMVLLSLHGLTAAEIGALLECHPATARRWIGRFNIAGPAGLADRPRPGRPRLGGRRLCARIAALLECPGPWTVRRVWRCLGRPDLSLRTLYRRIRQVAVWRRPCPGGGHRGGAPVVPAVTRRRPHSGRLGIPFVLDTGAVIALSQLDKTARTMLAAALREQSQVWVPAPVITELVRGNQRRDAAVNRVLKSVSDVHPLDEPLARDAGRLLAGGGTTVDAMVVATAQRVAGAGSVVIMTGDPRDITALVADDSRVRVAAV